MDRERWIRTRKLFEEALLRGVDEQTAYLEEQCSGDPKLLQEVISLLGSHRESAEFLELPSRTGLMYEATRRLRPGERFGHYILGKVISEGGMGTVYHGTQENPERAVAIKVMREGLTSPAAHRRFEYESQVLARLTHPNIAHVIEAGTHCMGGMRGMQIPFFVMEYVPDAQSITDYAWRGKLSLKERLKLFEQVCAAVEHGHRKGIIHRDLKPSNLLVDSSGQVKVIDFGVARVTGSDMRVTTTLTEVGELIGTMQYMSPEQCSADPDDLDTRSDVYALGVVLYELLCEELPYDMHRAAIFEAARIVREADPKRPSTTNRALRGDVETIVLKSLEKDRERRYQSVAALSDDIERYLRGDLIRAKSLGPLGLFWKRVQRSPTARAALSVSFLALLGFGAYLQFFSLPEIRAGRKLAEDARSFAEEERAIAEAERSKAQREASISSATSTFLQRMVSAANAFNQGSDARVVDVLDWAAGELADTYRDQPEVEFMLRETLSESYRHLGRFDDAEEQCRGAHAASLKVWGEGSVEELRARVQLGQILMLRNCLDEATSVLDVAVDDSQRILGEEHPDTLYARSALANTFLKKSKLEEAELLIRGVLERQRAILGEEHRNSLYSSYLLTQVLRLQGRLDEADTESESLVERSRRGLGPDHPDHLTHLAEREAVLRLLNRAVEAEQINRVLLETHRRLWGDEHPTTLSTINRLAASLSERGQVAEAETLLREALEISRALMGDDNPGTLAILNNLGVVLARQGKLGEARPFFEELLERRRRVQGEEHHLTIGAMTNVALVLQSEGELELAEESFRELIDIRRRVSGEEHPYTLRVMTSLASLLITVGKLTEAEELILEARGVHVRTLGENNLDTLNDDLMLARVYLASGRVTEGEALLEQGLARAAASLPAGHSLPAEYADYLGRHLLQVGRFEQAEPHLLRAHALLLSSFGPRFNRVCALVEALVQLYEQTDRPEMAEEWRAKLVE